MHISAGEVPRKEERSKLKRVLSVWGSKKGGKEKGRERERGEAGWMGARGRGRQLCVCVYVCVCVCVYV